MLLTQPAKQQQRCTGLACWSLSLSWCRTPRELNLWGTTSMWGFASSRFPHFAPVWAGWTLTTSQLTMRLSENSLSNFVRMAERYGIW